MAWVAVDRDGTERIFSDEPKRGYSPNWFVKRSDDETVDLPTGSIRKLIGRELTWRDEPMELVEAKRELLDPNGYLTPEMVAALRANATKVHALWSPIETAPRGSTPEEDNGRRDDPNYIEPPKILLHTKDGPVVGNYEWYYHPGYGNGASEYESPWRSSCGESANGVTHWMPIPEPPEEK